MTTESIDSGSPLHEGENPSAMVGTRLQQERTRRGLSEKAVADQLHITMHYVRAIESGTYDKLPGTVFARGYIKSYALLLELNEDELLDLFDQHIESESAVEQEQERRTAAHKKKTRMVPWLVISLLAFIAGFLGLWLYNKFFAEADDGIAIQNPSERAALQVTATMTGSTEKRSALTPLTISGSLFLSQGEFDPTEPMSVQFSSQAGLDADQIVEPGESRGDTLTISGTTVFGNLSSAAEYVTMALNGSDIGTRLGHRYYRF